MEKNTNSRKNITQQKRKRDNEKRKLEKDRGKDFKNSIKKSIQYKTYIQGI